MRFSVSVNPVTSNPLVVTPTENLAEPTTSNVNDGVIVPIPTFPDVATINDVVPDVPRLSNALPTGNVDV